CERHHVMIGILVARCRPGGSGMDAVGENLQIMSERWHKPKHGPLHRGYTRRAGRGLIEDAKYVGRGGLSLRLGLGSARLIRIENVPPLVAFWRLAPPAARAHRVAEG